MFKIRDGAPSRCPLLPTPLNRRPMPRNHRDVDREVKRDAIEQAAADLMLRHGYEATSMAAVADKAGVATNTVYWYFRNKDELLIAVLDRVVAEALERHTAARKKSATTTTACTPRDTLPTWSRSTRSAAWPPPKPRWQRRVREWPSIRSTSSWPWAAAGPTRTTAQRSLQARPKRHGPRHPHPDTQITLDWTSRRRDACHNWLIG